MFYAINEALKSHNTDLVDHALWVVNNAIAGSDKSLCELFTENSILLDCIFKLPAKVSPEFQAEILNEVARHQLFTSNHV